jgi:outer membrane protein assembly factor BamB
VFCIGWRNGNDVVSCLDDATGKVLWSQRYRSPKYGRHAAGDQRMYHGATATPELDPSTGLLFTLGCDGDLIAWDTTRDGKKVWQQNLYEKYGISRRPQITKRKGSRRDYGYTTSPFAFRDWVIVEAGATDHGNLIAFDKRTGKEIWGSENRDPAGHSGGPAPITLEGVPCLAVATAFGLHVARLDEGKAGKTVAEFDWKTDFCNTIAGIAVRGQDLLISSRYNQMAMARLSIDLKNGAREVWRNRYPTGVCTPVIHGGKIYFANKGVFCVDFETGKLDWAGGKIGDAGSCLVTGDNRLVVWGNGGDLSLIETAKRSPKKCIVLSERRRIFDDMAWPHLVLTWSWPRETCW